MFPDDHRIKYTRADMKEVIEREMREISLTMNLSGNFENEYWDIYEYAEPNDLLCFDRMLITTVVGVIILGSIVSIEMHIRNNNANKSNVDDRNK